MHDDDQITETRWTNTSVSTQGGMQSQRETDTKETILTREIGFKFCNFYWEKKRKNHEWEKTPTHTHTQVWDPHTTTVTLSRSNIFGFWKCQSGKHNNNNEIHLYASIYLLYLLLQGWAKRDNRVSHSDIALEGIWRVLVRLHWPTFIENCICLLILLFSIAAIHLVIVIGYNNAFK